jgi:hypothetical protein
MEHRCERGIETGEISGIFPKRFPSHFSARGRRSCSFTGGLGKSSMVKTRRAFQKIPAATKQAIFEILFKRKSDVPIY